jgi:tRNA(Ile)-lysidine synthase
MEIKLSPGVYVVAVSGGVDSMALLDLLARQRKPAPRLIVAHFDHGMRPDSRLDRELVQKAARQYGLAFVYGRAELGSGASEAAARQARYAFLDKIKTASGARAIVTAHHSDDLIETAIFNLLRGGGRLSLTSLYSDEIIRPLINFSKHELVAYAKSRGLDWRDDPTNQDLRYRRNYIRHKIVPRLGAARLTKFKSIIDAAYGLNQKVDKEVAKLLQALEENNELKKLSFIKLPHDVAREALAAWLRRAGIRQFDKKMLERLTVAAKTLRAGKNVDITANYQLAIGKQGLKIIQRGGWHARG